MLDAGRRETWDHTALLAMLIDNCQAFRADRPAATTATYHPYRQGRQAEAVATEELPPGQGFELLMSAFGFADPWADEDKEKRQ